MTSFFQENIDFLVLKSKKTSFDILIYIYSQGQEQFKSWISKKIFDWLGSQIISLIFIRREISCNNTHGKSLDIYLSKHVFTQEKLSSSGTVVPKSFLEKKLRLTSKRNIDKSAPKETDNSETNNSISWVLIPNHNTITHFIYCRNLFWIYRRKPHQHHDDKKSTKRADSSGDTFIISSFWFSRKKMDQLITECQDKFKENNKRNIPMYINSEFMGHVPERKMDTILLPNNEKERILNDIDSFLDVKTEEWYQDIIGIPYRRGYLLYGPPGCGKTSFVKALSHLKGLSLYIINLSSPDVDDQKLLDMIHSCNRSIILFEDIDSIFGSNEINNLKNPEVTNKRHKKVTNQVTFSGILNALDGIVAQEGNLIFMTTNYKDKLDSALIRPGRIDFEIEFGYTTKECCQQLFKNFYANYSDQSYDTYINELGGQISDKIPEKTLSIAQIQGHFLKYRDPRESIDNIGEIISLVK